MFRHIYPHTQLGLFPAHYTFTGPGPGLSVAGDSLYVADTNNHKIRVIDIKSGAVRTFEIAGLNAPRSEKVSAIQPD